jgi:hypothetical protein
MTNGKLFIRSIIISILLFTTLSCNMTLSVIKPAILKNHFNKGLEFKEIINGHRLQDFDDKVDIHMLKSTNGNGCRRFSMDDVNILSFLFLLNYLLNFNK